MEFQPSVEAAEASMWSSRNLGTDLCDLILGLGAQCGVLDRFPTCVKVALLITAG